MRTPFLCALWLCATILPAQAPPQPEAPPAERLRALLQELRQLDGKAWAERLAALEAEVKAHEQQAAGHREQARAQEQQAAAADQKATALRAEMERLRALQKIVLELPAAAPPAMPAGATTDPPKAQAPKSSPAANEPTKAEAPKNEAPKSGSIGTEPPKAAAPETAAPTVTWAEVGPVFGDSCTGCHDPDSRKGGLDLTSFAAALQGGGSGRSIVPGEPDQSRLYRLIAQLERPFMPRDADPLGKALVGTIRRWIDQGACEDQDGVRAFQLARAAAAKAAAAAEAAMSGPAPLPENLPATALRVPPRPVPVQALARSPRAPLLALPACGQVLLLDAALQPLGVLPCAMAKVATVAFSADGVVLAAAGGEAGRRGQAVVYDVRTGSVLGSAGEERDVPLAVAVHHRAEDGRTLVALGGSGRRARVHRLGEGAGAKLLDGAHDDFVLGLSFSPDGALLAAGDRQGKIMLWELDGGRAGLTLTGHDGAVNAVAFHRGGKWLLSAGDDGTLRLWDVAEGKERWRQGAHKGAGLAVAFGPGDAVASCGSDGRIAVVTAAGAGVATSAAVGDWLYGVAFGEGDGVVFAGDARGRVHRFEVEGRKLSAAMPLQPSQ